MARHEPATEDVYRRARTPRRNTIAVHRAMFATGYTKAFTIALAAGAMRSGAERRRTNGTPSRGSRGVRRRCTEPTSCASALPERGSARWFGHHRRGEERESRCPTRQLARKTFTSVGLRKSLTRVNREALARREALDRPGAESARPRRGAPTVLHRKRPATPFFPDIVCVW